MALVSSSSSRWLGKLPAGQVSDQPGISMDLMASVVKVAALRERLAGWEKEMSASKPRFVVK